MSVTMRYVTFISIFALFVVKITCAEYNVHWLSEQITIDRAMPSSKQPVDIYCYRGSTKSILSLWHTVKFHIKIKDNEFGQYIGTSPQEVFKDYTEDSYGWSVNPFQRRASTSVSLDLFNSTCMAINTKQRHSIQLQINRIDIWRILTLFLGMSLIFLSRPLSGNPVFFYLCGILVGVCASFMVVVYYVSKLLPRKPVMYGMLIGGWTVGVYIFQQIWQNIKSILLTYQMHLFWYTLIAGFISFVVCYRIGPPQNKRSQNLVMWTLQGVGMLLIFFSSQYQEASAALMVITMIIKYFPESFIHSCRSYWHRRFPPKRRLLSNEEYYEQGARETKHALDSLREYCASPDCAQWRIMMKLNDSKRFASFVEGDSHLSDDEILDYEAYAFSADRQPKRQSRAAYNTRASASASHLEISDDDSTDTDNEI